MTRATNSRWVLGACLSMLALITHTSGTLNLDGINPLMLSGCAHNPAQSLVLKNRVEGEQHDIRQGNFIQLLLSDGTSVEGNYLGKEPSRLATPAELKSDQTKQNSQNELAIKIGLRTTGFGQLPTNEVRWVRVRDITAIRFRTRRNTWSYVGVTALLGSIPTGAFGWELSGYGPFNVVHTQNRSLNRLLTTATCAVVFGAVPGATVGGLVSLLPGSKTKVQTGSQWTLE